MLIAICDDEKEIRGMFAEKIRRIYPKAELDQYRSGEELLSAGRMPDILLLDIRMPGRDGMEKQAGDEFYRSHRAYLVNFNYIVKYDAANIYLKRGQALMAKQNYREFVQRYLRYNQRKGQE